MPVNIGLHICRDRILAMIEADPFRSSAESSVCLSFSKPEQVLIPDGFPQQLYDTVQERFGCPVSDVTIAAPLYDYEQRCELLRAFPEQPDNGRTFSCISRRLLPDTILLQYNLCCSLKVSSAYIISFGGNLDSPYYTFGFFEDGILEICFQDGRAGESHSLSELLDPVLTVLGFLRDGMPDPRRASDRLIFCYDETVFPTERIQRIPFLRKAAEDGWNNIFLVRTKQTDIANGALLYSKKLYDRVKGRNQVLLLNALRHNILASVGSYRKPVFSSGQTYPLHRNILFEIDPGDYAMDPGSFQLSLLFSVEGRPEETLKMPVPFPQGFLPVVHPGAKEKICLELEAAVEADEALSVLVRCMNTGREFRFEPDIFALKLQRIRQIPAVSSASRANAPWPFPQNASALQEQTGNRAGNTDRQKPSSASLPSLHPSEGNEHLISKMIELIDSTDYGIRLLSDEDKGGAPGAGLLAIRRQMLTILESVGIESYESLGQPFDPSLHEAFEHIISPDYPENIVIEELRRGYRRGGKVFRYSLVKVAN